MEPYLKLLGLGTPFYYAAATYIFFHRLDKRASAAAKGAISKWAETWLYNREQIAAAIVEMFERLYGYPFLSWRTVLRVIVFSTVVHLLVWYELDAIGFYSSMWIKTRSPWWRPFFVLFPLGNIVSDY